jgi:hypothetical protein
MKMFSGQISSASQAHIIGEGACEGKSLFARSIRREKEQEGKRKRQFYMIDDSKLN